MRLKGKAFRNETESENGDRGSEEKARRHGSIDNHADWVLHTSRGEIRRADQATGYQNQTA